MRSSYVPASASGIIALILAGAAWAEAVPRVVQSRAFFEALEFGETVEIVRNGPISIEAKCEQDIEDPDNPDEFRVDAISLLATTTVPGAVGEGVGNFLDPSTPEDARTMFFSQSLLQVTPYTAIITSRPLRLTDRAVGRSHPDGWRYPGPRTQHLRRRLPGGWDVPYFPGPLLNTGSGGRA